MVAMGTRNGRLQRVASVITAACSSLACAQPQCTYKCEECPPSAYYTLLNGTCTFTGKETNDWSSYGFGAFYCGNGNVLIHSNITCLKMYSANASKYGYIGTRWDFRVTWSDSHGCRVESNPPFWVGVDQVSAPVCLGVIRRWRAIASVIVGTVVGVLFAAIGTISQRNTVSDNFDVLLHHRQEFWPGAKRLASQAKVGYVRRYLVFSYRVCQVIANVWLPMLLMIFFDSCIVLPLWFLLYFVPGFTSAGKHVFMQPAYILAPPDVSLYGIDHLQPDMTFYYILSAFRPLIMCGAVLISCLLFRGILATHTTGDVFNASGFFKAGLMSGFAPIVMGFVAIVSAFGSFMHMIMTAGIVLQKWFQGHPNHAMSLVQDWDLVVEVTSTASSICKVAVEIDNADDTSDSRIEDDETGRQKILRLCEVQPLTRCRVAKECAAILVGLCAFIYKIAVFIRCTRYILAGIITAAMSEAIFVLIFNGHLRRAPDSIRRAARDGVATLDFLACIQWKDGIVGVPDLMVTIFGLPLADQTGPISAACSIFFMMTGTRALSTFIQDVVDDDMYNAGEPLGDDEHDMDARDYIRAMVTELERTRAERDGYSEMVETPRDGQYVDTHEGFRAAFNQFDTDGDGFISASELQHHLVNHRTGADLSNEEVEEMVRAVDHNGDGYIDYQEFLEIMKAE